MLPSRWEGLKEICGHQSMQTPHLGPLQEQAPMPCYMEELRNVASVDGDSGQMCINTEWAPLGMMALSCSAPDLMPVWTRHPSILASKRYGLGQAGVIGGRGTG